MFCRFPKKSDKSRAPEPRVHFALSLGCASSARIRIYQPETLDEDLQQAAVEYLTTNAPKNRCFYHFNFNPFRCYTAKIGAEEAYVAQRLLFLANFSF